MVLGQIAVADKSNEITAMPQRLHLPDIRGRIITADSRNLLITGPSGVGKTWLARALGQNACRDNVTVIYHRLPRLFAELELAHGDGRFPRLFRSLAKAPHQCRFSRQSTR